MDNIVKLGFRESNTAHHIDIIIIDTIPLTFGPFPCDALNQNWTQLNNDGWWWLVDVKIKPLLPLSLTLSHTYSHTSNR